MSGSKDAILGRIREALKIAAPVPGHDHSGGEVHDHTRAMPEPSTYKAWLPPAGEAWDDWCALFARNSAELKTNFVRCASLADATRVLKELSEIERWAQVACHRVALADDAACALGLPIVYADAGFDPNAMERCDVGVTVCDALIAQTGSILLTTASAGGRTLSVLPPHHVVIATREQLLPDLTAGYDLLHAKYGKTLPSFITLITGPSRTGDIERILVLGAHGPKKLTVILVG